MEGRRCCGRTPAAGHRRGSDVSRDESRLRDELRWIQSRYDDGKLLPAVYAVVKLIEPEISWRVHAQQENPRA